MGFSRPDKRLPHALCGVAALCLLTIFAGGFFPLAAQDPATPVTEIAADKPSSLSVHPREYQQVGLKLVANQYNELRLDVGQAATRGIFIKAIVQLPGQPDSDPYISDNAESFLRIPILPGPQATSAALKITVLNSSKGNVAPVIVSMALSAEPVTLENTRQADALSVFGHAERLRRETGIVVRTVGMITTAKQAEAIVTEGKADMVALARAFLDNPHWGWHAAQALSADIARPVQYQRSAPKLWPGAALRG